MSSTFLYSMLIPKNNTDYKWNRVQVCYVFYSRCCTSTYKRYFWNSSLKDKNGAIA